MNKRYKTLLVWVLLVVAFLAMWHFLQPESGPPAGTDATSHVEPSGGGEAAPWASTLVTLLPMIFIGVMFFLFMRRLGGGSQNVFALRKTTARLLPQAPETTFAHVGGAADCKRKLGEVVDFLKAPKRWEQAGARLPSGVLLEGPPGCGKTLLARAVAGEAKVPFFEISASEFVELFVGVGAARVRDLFEQAAKKAPAIVFIDELDAIGRRRGAGTSGLSHHEREQTLNQLLTNLDGFRKAKRVVVIAATNRADILDAALLRPGRFDVRLRVPSLSVEARAEVLAVHTKAKPLLSGIDLNDLARRTPGLSGAELEHLTNEAAILALRRARAEGTETVSVTRADFDEALAERRSESRRFDRLDAAIIESVSQLSQPTGRVHLRATFDTGDVTEGDLVWVDAGFLKVRLSDGATALLAKGRIAKLEALQGTESVLLEEVVEDRWARQGPDAA